MTNDNWGRCCDNCPYYGHPIKPCRSCTGAEREIRDGDILVYKTYNIVVRKWDDEKYIVLPMFSRDTDFPLTSGEARFGDKILCTHWLCTIRKSVVERLPRVGRVNEEITLEAVRHGFGSGLKEGSPLEEGEPLTRKNERYYKHRELLEKWCRDTAEEIESQIEEDES